MTRLPADVEVGAELPTIQRTATLATAVAYAGASGDLNPLHYDPSFAAAVSPTGGVIAHGMFSMGLVAGLVAQWAGGPDRVVELSVRFSRPWAIDTTAEFGGEVSGVEDDRATLKLWARNGTGEQMLRGTATVRLR